VAGDLAGLDGGAANLLPPGDVRAPEGVRPKTFRIEAHRSGSGVQVVVNSMARPIGCSRLSTAQSRADPHEDDESADMLWHSSIWFHDGNVRFGLAQFAGERVAKEARPLPSTRPRSLRFPASITQSDWPPV